MAQQMVQRWCPNDGTVMAVQNRPNHILHLLLTLLTAGVWAIVWIGLSLSRPPAICTKCGHLVERSHAPTDRSREPRSIVVFAVIGGGLLLLWLISH